DTNRPVRCTARGIADPRSLIEHGPSRPPAAHLDTPNDAVRLFAITSFSYRPAVEKLDIPQGTLALMILTILSREPMHGYGISQRLAVLSHDPFRVNPGSLFSLLVRLG